MEIRDIINYAGFIVGILGILLSIYLYKKGIESKDPRCYYKTFKNISKLSDEKDTKIKITYGQEEVTRIFTTYVWVWNGGRKPINKTDIPSQSSVKINFCDEEFTPKILDYKIVKVSRPEINFSAFHSGETALAISFDFLDQDDGAVLEVQHTGSSDTELQSEGVILGVPEGLKIIRTTTAKKSFFRRAILRINSLLDYRKSPKSFYTFSTITIAIMIGMFGYMLYDINYNPRISTTTVKFEEALQSEFPQASEQNVINIKEKIISKNNVIANLLAVFIMAGYVIVFIGMFVYIARKDIIMPHPKSLSLSDDLLKFIKDKETS
ncbi:MAG: hypothetical protein IPP66_08425 [Anaerolineales bacterium]|nr:hypothetical protein [Anaerolineales bacterium]